MVLSIVVNEEANNFVGSMMSDELVTLTGRIVSVHRQDDAIDKAFEKVEQFENLIAMGLIDQDALDAIGYKE